MGGDASVGVVPSFREVRWFIYRIGCLLFPLSLTLSPRSAGGAKEPEALGCFMHLKRENSFDV